MMYKRNKSVGLLLLLWVPPLPERGIKGERERLKKYYCPIKQRGAPFRLKIIAPMVLKLKKISAKIEEAQPNLFKY